MSHAISTEHCWSQIGVEGDCSCPQLEAVGHCWHCPVYHAAGQRLLDREIPLDYLEAWTQVLAQPLESSPIVPVQPSDRSTDSLAVMIFRLGREQFALPVSVLYEVIWPVSIHTLPHRTTDLFLGLVNHRGEILPCVSLSQFLQVDTPIDPTYSRINQRRMVVINQPETRWVFPVDEVYRVHRLHPGDILEPPIVIAKAQQTYSRGVFSWHDFKVNALHASRLLNALDRRPL